MLTTVTQAARLIAAKAREYALDVVTDQVMGEPDDQLTLVGLKLAADLIVWLDRTFYS